ncbi:hypothetical protein ACFXNW_28880 [Nocardia sp. NPDC059180]|uniref:hypothetical protein n=1 Tax=Nocardia sp. NPDC059180 TaxID=3346761 RepID=UPI00368B63BA
MSREQREPLKFEQGGDELNDRESVQTRRAHQFALCTFALAYDRATDGAEGVFDQALTNGLAAIVAHTWPGQEKDKQGPRVRSASQLLDVIENNTDKTGRIPHDHDAPVDDDAASRDPFDLPPYTVVDIATLRDSLTATQVIRHARDVDDDPTAALTEDHVKALMALDWHPALRSVRDVHMDRDWERDGRSDDAETDRAQRYYDALDDMEIERRRALDYTTLAQPTMLDDAIAIEGCPVCGACAFVARAHDGLRSEVGIGHCWVCSYERTGRIAEREMIDELLRRAAQ